MEREFVLSRVIRCQALRDDRRGRDPDPEVRLLALLLLDHLQPGQLVEIFLELEFLFLCEPKSAVFYHESQLLNTTAFFTCDAHDTKNHFSGKREIAGVLEQAVEDDPEILLVGLHDLWDVRVDLHLEFDALRLRLIVKIFEEFRDKYVHIEAVQCDLRELLRELVIDLKRLDYLEEIVRGGHRSVDFFEIVVYRELNDLKHSHDRIERRPDIMCHVRQYIILRFQLLLQLGDTFPTLVVFDDEHLGIFVSPVEFEHPHFILLLLVVAHAREVPSESLL